MPDSSAPLLIQRRYRQIFGASIKPNFNAYFRCGCATERGAALGYCRAGEERLFLEAYLDHSIEQVLQQLLGRPVSRDQIIEIGNFASDNALAMIELWALAANDLGSAGEVAVATLTRPLRDMFRRVGIPIHEIAAARPEHLTSSDSDWGRYYDQDPIVCAGIIAEGQDAISRFLIRRKGRKAA